MSDETEEQEEIEDDPLANVIQLHSGAINPQLIDDMRRASVRADKEAMLEELDSIRSSVERGEIEALSVIGRGAPGHLDVSWLSHGLYEAPAISVGLMQMQLFAFQLQAFQQIEMIPED